MLVLLFLASRPTQWNTSGTAKLETTRRFFLGGGEWLREAHSLCGEIWHLYMYIDLFILVGWTFSKWRFFVIYHTHLYFLFIYLLCG